MGGRPRPRSRAVQLSTPPRRPPCRVKAGARTVSTCRVPTAVRPPSIGTRWAAGSRRPTRRRVWRSRGLELGRRRMEARAPHVVGPRGAPGGSRHSPARSRTEGTPYARRPALCLPAGRGELRPAGREDEATLRRGVHGARAARAWNGSLRACMFLQVMWHGHLASEMRGSASVCTCQMQRRAR